jgi:hypothetical protein
LPFEASAEHNINKASDQTLAEKEVFVEVSSETILT